METRLKLAIQKSGRLHDDSLNLLKDCGIDLKNGINKLKTEADNFPLEVFFFVMTIFLSMWKTQLRILGLWARM